MNNFSPENPRPWREMWLVRSTFPRAAVWLCHIALGNAGVHKGHSEVGHTRGPTPLPGFRASGGSVGVRRGYPPLGWCFIATEFMQYR